MKPGKLKQLAEQVAIVVNPAALNGENAIHDLSAQIVTAMQSPYELVKQQVFTIKVLQGMRMDDGDEDTQDGNSEDDVQVEGFGMLTQASALLREQCLAILKWEESQVSAYASMISAVRISPP